MRRVYHTRLFNAYLNVTTYLGISNCRVIAAIQDKEVLWRARRKAVVFSGGGKGVLGDEAQSSNKSIFMMLLE